VAHGRVRSGDHSVPTASETRVTEGPFDISADEWINRNDAREYMITEDSVRIAPELILSLLWWKDERQLLELESE
jgi:hypothetical protein